MAWAAARGKIRRSSCSPAETCRFGFWTLALPWPFPRDDSRGTLLPIGDGAIIAATQLILRCPRHAEPLYNNAMQDQTPHALEGVIQSSAVGLTDRARTRGAVQRLFCAGTRGGLQCESVALACLPEPSVARPLLLLFVAKSSQPADRSAAAAAAAMLSANSSPKLNRARSAPSRPACPAIPRFLRLFFQPCPTLNNRKKKRTSKCARKKWVRNRRFLESHFVTLYTTEHDFWRARSNWQNDGCSRRSEELIALDSTK